MSTQTPPEPATETVNWTRFLVRMAIASLLFPALLFLSAGQWDWGMGWVYVVLVVSITVISRYLMIRQNPALLEERSKSLSREDTKQWDKILAPLW